MTIGDAAGAGAAQGTSGDAAGAVFAALGEPTRRQVVRYLTEGPATATGLARRLPVSRQAVAKHLATLEDAGLVAAARAGRETRYALTPEPMTDAIAWMTAVGAAWDGRLARLEGHLAEE